MTPQLDVAGVGEAMLLFHLPAGESLLEATSATVDVAGAELNTCAAVARFGLRSALCTRVGDDAAGDRVRKAVRDLGADDSLVATDPGWPTGLFVRELPVDGERRSHYYRAGSAASRLDAGDADRLLAAGPRMAVVSGLTAALGDGPSACVRAVLDRAADAGVRIAVDANLRPALGRLEQVTELLVSRLDRMDVLVLGTDEAAVLFGDGTPDQLLRRLSGTVGEVVLKAGADGAYYLDENGELGHVAALAERVVDPVGAGDAFTGSYLAARLHGLSRAAAVQVASRTAAGVVETAGDHSGLPTPEQAAELLRAGAASPVQ